MKNWLAVRSSGPMSRQSKLHEINFQLSAFNPVGNTRYVRFMYQMICPVLERLQAMEGGDASDGAGTGTEIDEVRGGLRAHPSGWLEPGGGGGGSGCLGAHLPALARPLRGGGSRRSLRPPPGPPLGAAARRWTRWRGCWSCSTPATGTSRPSTSTRSWWPITASSAATTGCG